jgi:hypothetical protein
MSKSKTAVGDNEQAQRTAFVRDLSRTKTIQQERALAKAAQREADQETHGPVVKDERRMKKRRGKWRAPAPLVSTRGPKRPTAGDIADQDDKRERAARIADGERFAKLKRPDHVNTGDWGLFRRVVVEHLETKHALANLGLNISAATARKRLQRIREAVGWPRPSS